MINESSFKCRSHFFKNPGILVPCSLIWMTSYLLNHHRSIAADIITTEGTESFYRIILMTVYFLSPLCDSWTLKDDDVVTTINIQIVDYVWLRRVFMKICSSFVIGPIWQGLDPHFKQARTRSWQGTLAKVRSSICGCSSSSRTSGLPGAWVFNLIIRVFLAPDSRIIFGKSF